MVNASGRTPKKKHTHTKHKTQNKNTCEQKERERSNEATIRTSGEAAMTVIVLGTDCTPASGM
jgi:hypothetical protein